MNTIDAAALCPVRSIGKKRRSFAAKHNRTGTLLPSNNGPYQYEITAEQEEKERLDSEHFLMSLVALAGARVQGTLCYARMRCSQVA